MTFDGLTYEKEKFSKRTSMLNSGEINWIIERVLREFPVLSDYKNNKEHEEQLLSKINLMLYDFEKNKPSNIREYVETQLKKREYKKQLETLLGAVDATPLFAADQLEKLKSKAKDLENKIESDDREIYKELYSRIQRVFFVISLRKEGKTERDVHVRGWFYPGDKEALHNKMQRHQSENQEEMKKLKKKKPAKAAKKNIK